MLQILCFKLLKCLFLIAPQKQKDRPDNNDKLQKLRTYQLYD